MGLINWKSPHEELVKTVEEELPKAVRWLRKKTSDRKTERLLSDLAFKAKTSGKDLCLPHPVEYASGAGNRWVMTQVATHEGRICDGLAMYGLTGKYMWAVTPLCIGNEWFGNPEHSVMVFSPHFFQRFYERLNIQQEDRVMALRNFILVTQQLPLRMVERKGGGYKVLARLKGCVCYGHTVGRVVYVNTILPESHLCDAKIQSTRGFRKMSDSTMHSIDDIMEKSFYQERPMQWFRKCAKSFGFGKDSARRIAFIIGIRLMSSRLINEYRKRVFFLPEYNIMATSGTLKGCYDDFAENRKPLTFENLRPWMVQIIKASHQEVNPVALSEALEEMKKIGGDEKVDLDNFHFMANSLRTEALKELKL